MCCRRYCSDSLWHTMHIHIVVLFHELKHSCVRFRRDLISCIRTLRTSVVLQEAKYKKLVLKPPQTARFKTNKLKSLYMLFVSRY